MFGRALDATNLRSGEILLPLVGECDPIHILGVTEVVDKDCVIPQQEYLLEAASESDDSEKVLQLLFVCTLGVGDHGALFVVSVIFVVRAKNWRS